MTIGARVRMITTNVRRYRGGRGDQNDTRGGSVGAKKRGVDVLDIADKRRNIIGKTILDAKNPFPDRPSCFCAPAWPSQQTTTHFRASSHRIDGQCEKQSKCRRHKSLQRAIAVSYLICLVCHIIQLFHILPQLITSCARRSHGATDSTCWRQRRWSTSSAAKQGIAVLFRLGRGLLRSRGQTALPTVRIWLLRDMVISDEPDTYYAYTAR